MKKIQFFVLLVLIFTLFITACFSPFTGEDGTSLVINLAGNARVLTGFNDAVESSTLSFNIRLTNLQTGEIRQAQVNSSGTQARATGLSPGNWDIDVDVSIFGYSYAIGKEESFPIESGQNSVNVQMERLPYSIALNINNGATYDFGTVTAGYTPPPPALTVNVRSFGNDTPTSLAISPLIGFAISPNPLTGANLAQDGTGESFTIRPIASLGAGTHGGPVTVSAAGVSATFYVSFTVNPSLATLTGITATYNGTDPIYPSMTLNDLKINLTVIADYSDGSTAPVPDSSYTLSIPGGGTTLAVGSHTVTVTHNDNSLLTNTFPITVDPTPTYNITLSQTGTYTFTPQTYGDMFFGQFVTVTNNGNQATGDLTVALSGTNASSFSLSRTLIPTIASPGNDSFTVEPISTLNPGTYTATVTVSNVANSITASFNVNFTVNFTNVQSITITSANTMTAGVLTPLNLTGTVSAGATYNTIVWSVQDAGGTGASIPTGSNVLTATSAGTVTVTARVVNGIFNGTTFVDFTETFTITVQGSTGTFSITFAQISDLTLSEITGPTISLSGTSHSNTATLTLTGGPYTNINWLMDGVSLGSNTSLILNASNNAYNGVGDHSLTLELESNGVPYSKTVTFKVVE